MTAKKTRRAAAAKAKTNGSATKKTAAIAPVLTPGTLIFSRFQDSFRDAGAAFRQASGLAGDESRKIALKVLANAEENFAQGFVTWRAVLEAGNFAEAVKIQQQAMRDTFQRSLKQIREVGEMVAASGQNTIRPLGKFVANLHEPPPSA